MAKGKNGDVSFTACVAGVSTLKPLGKNESPNPDLKVTLRMPATKVDINKLVRFQNGEELEVTLSPAQGELPNTGTDG